MGGVTPIKSIGAARYMQKYETGMIVPEELISRIKGAEDRNKEGIKIAVETIQRLKEIEGVAGFDVMAIAWEEMVPELVESAGLYPRPTVN